MRYQALKNQTYKQYKRIKQVYCPYLKVEVRFNSKGFWHLIYRSRNKKRPISTQILRFKLFLKAVQLLKLTTTLQEYHKISKVIYWGFIAIIDGGNGQPYFFSIIPNWITNRKRDRLLHKGNLEED